MVYPELGFPESGPLSSLGLCACVPDLLHKPQPIGISQSVWVLQTVCSGVDPGDHRFSPRFVEVVDVWKDL